MAGGAIDLDQVALPEVLDPRGVEGKHSRARCSWYVQGKRAGEAASMANAAQTRQRPSRAVNCARQERRKRAFPQPRAEAQTREGPIRAGMHKGHKGDGMWLGG